MLLAIGLALGGLAANAGATTPSGCTTNADGSLTCTASNPGTDGSAGGSPSAGATGCAYKGKSIPCTDQGAWWIPSQSCYAAPGALVPGVFTAKPGFSWWVCDFGPDGGLPANAGAAFLLPDAQAPVANPATLAQTALGSMQLETASVETAPAAPHSEVIGVQVWLWIPQAQWRTLTKTVTAGATAVTATATPELVTWNMGDGSAPTVCGGPGEPWSSSFTDAAETSCGYTYRTISAGQPGGVFTIAATISYGVSWTCTGVCTSTSGDLGTVTAPAGRGSIKSVQRQTVVIQP